LTLLKNSGLADEYKNGACAVFRLTVDDYHRYAFFDSGYAGNCYRIPGVYHTVGNISDGKFKVYSENTREYTELFTENFGKAIFMEVGALLVGRIMNRPGVSCFSRGDEKGYFCFGGSTIVLFFKENTVKFDSDIEKFSAEGIEVKVGIGEKIGEAF
jgi:phosphatidylserine decarboxylase